MIVYTSAPPRVLATGTKRTYAFLYYCCRYLVTSNSSRFKTINRRQRRTLLLGLCWFGGGGAAGMAGLENNERGFHVVCLTVVRYFGNNFWSFVFLEC